MADRITTERILELWERSNPPPDEVRAAFRDLIDARAEIDALRVEEERQRAEIAALRASLGERSGAEPVGCPLPGACACPTLTPAIDMRKYALGVRAAWQEARGINPRDLRMTLSWQTAEARRDLIATLTRCGLTDAEAVADGAE